jgi:hypothetical protein
MRISQYAPNQFLVSEENGNAHFKSYETTICNIINGKIKLNAEYWNKNQTDTTNRYLGTFLKIGQAKVKIYINSAIESGLIELTTDIKKF